MGAADLPQARTLSESLVVQARGRGEAVCMRQKRFGRWQVWTWRQAAEEVTRLSASLAARGFGRGAELLVVSEPRAEALLLMLAAQRLGGVALPEALDAPIGPVPDGGRHFAFVEGGEVLDRLAARCGDAPLLAVSTDPHGLVPAAAVSTVAYETLTDAAPDDTTATDAQPLAQPEAPAFVFAGASGVEGVTAVASVSHREALTEARRLLERAPIHAGHDALVPRSISTEVGRAFVGAWLVAGFCLHFPERAATRDVDRRELAPSLVVATAASYGALRQRVIENLPPPGTGHRRLVDWALAPSTRGLDELLRRTAGEVIVRTPLRRVLGLSRVVIAWVDGGPPEEPVRAFFSRLGLELVPLVDGEPLRSALPQPEDASRTGILSAVPEEAS